jgi:hypothetical protein
MYSNANLGCGQASNANLGCGQAKHAADPSSENYTFAERLHIPIEELKISSAILAKNVNLA